MRKPASFYFFKRKPIILKDRYKLWRGVADLLGFTTQERLSENSLPFCSLPAMAWHFGCQAWPKQTRMILSAYVRNN
jgi:hypothetical protein